MFWLNSWVKMFHSFSGSHGTVGRKRNKQALALLTGLNLICGTVLLIVRLVHISLAWAELTKAKGLLLTSIRKQGHLTSANENP